MEEAIHQQDMGAVWEAFVACRDRKVRDQLIERYLPLARSMAMRIYRVRFHDTCPFEDYLQYARLGLIEAIDRFDPRRQTSFEAYSAHRIRGAVLNGLVKETEFAAQRQARLTQRTSELSAEIIPNAARASLDDFIDLTVGLAVGWLLDTDDDEARDDLTHANPYVATELRDLRSCIRAAVEKLPEREAKIIRRHYYEQEEFQQVAEEMCLTKGRISQLHARALALIRKALEDKPQLDRKL